MYSNTRCHTMKALCLACAMLLTGCSTLSLVLPTQVPYDKDDAKEYGEASHSSFTLAEGAWQSLNVIDMGQSLNIANSPTCFHETNPLTSALIGKHPSDSGVIITSIAYAIGYRMISQYLENKDTLDENGEYTGWHDVYNIFQGTMLVTKAYTVWNNNNIGLRPFGHAYKC